MPWVVAGLPLAAMTLRMVRATFPEVLAEDYVRTARARDWRRGGSRAPRAAGRGRAGAVAAGAYAPMLIANVILIEAVFGIPGCTG